MIFLRYRIVSGLSIFTIFIRHILFHESLIFLYQYPNFGHFGFKSISSLEVRSWPCLTFCGTENGLNHFLIETQLSIRHIRDNSMTAMTQRDRHQLSTKFL